MDAEGNFFKHHTIQFFSQFPFFRGGGGMFGRKKRDLTADKPSGDSLSLRFKRKFEEQSQIAEPVFA